MTNYYLVLIETSGNQNFIFSTNKLKENIGASELTYQAGTHWIAQAVANCNKEVLFKDWQDSVKFREMLRQQVPLESSTKKVEILVAASGKALLLTQDEKAAKEIISEVTHKALKDAPGLDVSGVCEKIENWDQENSLADAIKKIHKKFEQERSRRPSPLNRFLRLPIIADCSVSELPAREFESLTSAQKRDKKQPKPISVVSLSKRNTAGKAKERLSNLDSRLQASIDQILDDADNEAERKSWLAVVHADGNGLGQIFLNFEDYIGADKSNRNYINNYREFSLRLDEYTEAAFKTALDVFPNEENCRKNNVAPIVPLIIGGDDLTVVCDGHYALEFTKVFLQEFENQTQIPQQYDNPKILGIAGIAHKAFGVSKLSACAGIAIIKPHFPFSVAYHLAEKLIKSAKDVKRKVTCLPTDTIPENTPFPCSAIDFHILYDTSGVDLSDIRKKLKPDNKTLLYNRPYIVTIPQENNINLPDCDQEDTGMKWVEPRRWEVLEKWVNLLKYLPTSQTHTMRTALFLGEDAAEAQCKLIESRYESLKNFLKENNLFQEQKIKDDQDQLKSYQVTPFLDALNTIDFLKNDTRHNNQEAQ